MPLSPTHLSNNSFKLIQLILLLTGCRLARLVGHPSHVQRLSPCSRGPGLKSGMWLIPAYRSPRIPVALQLSLSSGARKGPKKILIFFLLLLAPVERHV